ncbi:MULTISPECIES: restriction endonuclease subunit S [unclassified Arenibacter]|uniref:restriction endonuclease subunit S n=1 Tax=unclassified Arenibacter TaxID=2615047 RepID=UPI000E350D99|nr:MULTISPECIES: restriction endonuclease subunit S [unclassified Arenibacter]MCM4162994.1 restriction endonuclease subunit S [Arenibacter sp. A80]RFT57033.1 restriction endonuclease subunit S [Arenibacter sp. P308M17]
MNNNWKTLKLGEVATLQRGFDLPSRKRINGNYPIIAASGYTEMHNEYKVKGPGVITGRSGTLGKFFYEKKDFWPLNTSLWVKSFNGNNPLFIYYFLQTLNFLEFNSGTSVPTLNRNDVHSLEVEIPPIQEQKAIASILSALDDKIENNLAMNKTLEYMAMALYKHWFVDFGPFKDGEFVDSKLGMIPKGWEVKTYSNITTKITDGAHYSPKTYNYGYPMASVKDMHDWGFNLNTCRQIGEDDFTKLIAQGCQPLKDDIVIAKDGSWLKHAFVVEQDLPLVLLSSIAILRPNGDLNPHLINLNLKLTETKGRMASIVTGAVIQRIVLKDFRKFEVIVPDKNSQEKACSKIIPLIEKCWANNHENQTLTEIRNMMLPKLISGEVRLKEFEETLANVL